MRRIHIYGTQCKWLIIVTLALVLLLVSACGPNNTTTQPAAASTQVPVNGFGSAANHVHSLLAFPKHVLVLATHYGIFRSEDSGATWKEVAAGPNQLMQGLMAYSLTASPLNPKRLYVLTLPAINPHPGTLPFGRILGLLAIPGAAGQLLAYGSDGMARSTDGGAHWQVLKGINGGIYDAATAGANSPIYASGDAGIFSSLDGGKTFTLVDAEASFTSLTVSPVQPQVIYGKTGLATYRSSNGGHTWSALPHISGNLAVLAVDPSNASQVYLSLSYPTAVYQLGQNGTQWQSLTPRS